MDEALEILASEQCVRSRATPRLKLLLEREPAHHVFFSNLLEALKLRRTPRLDLTQPPMDFWRNVFLPSELPWKSFQESLLWHLVAAIAAWALSQGGEPAGAARPGVVPNRGVDLLCSLQSFPGGAEYSAADQETGAMAEAHRRRGLCCHEGRCGAAKTRHGCSARFEGGDRIAPAQSCGIRRTALGTACCDQFRPANSRYGGCGCTPSAGDCRARQSAGEPAEFGGCASGGDGGSRRPSLAGRARSKRGVAAAGASRLVSRRGNSWRWKRAGSRSPATTLG